MKQHPTEYRSLVDDVFALATRNPNDCVFLGVDARRGELPDPSLKEIAAEVSEARALLARADSIDRSALDFDAALDLDLARLILEARIHAATFTFNGRTTHQQMPTAGDDISNGIFMMFVNDPRPDGERLADITARIEAIPAYLSALLGRLDTPVERWVSIDCTKIAGLPDLFATLHGWAEGVGWADAGRLGTAIARAGEAMSGYVERLRALPTTTELHVGDAIARRIVALRGIEMSLEELHGMARDFLAETLGVIDTLRGRLAAKYGLAPHASADEVQQHLDALFPAAPHDTPLERILDAYREEHERIMTFVRELDLFPIPEQQVMKIMRTPAFMAPTIPAGAMEPPPPFREGMRTSLVYLTLSEELRAEHTRLSIPNMMIHEGIPGHHLQLATAAMHSSVIRRLVNAPEHAEGWTTMLEDYMLDLGYLGSLTDEARFIGKRDIARIGARVVIDLYFMTGDRSYLDVGVDCDLSSADPFVAAGNLLAVVTGFVPGRVQAELNWYSQQRGYPLSYLTGNRLVWQLKRDMADAQRGTLEGRELDRAFHRLYLESGNMPLSFLRRVFQHHGMIAA